MMRDPNAGKNTGMTAGGPISRGFALVVLAALLLLLVMRRLFGSISVSGGVR